jgi:cell division protein FtsI/penicillin-binding protein 2
MKAQYSKVRLGVICIFFALMFVFFFARLVFVQVVKGEDYRERARRQYLQSIELPAARGGIFDVKGNMIAVNDGFKSLFAYPLNKKDVEKSYRQLSRVLGKNQKYLRRNHKLTPKKFCWIKRGMIPDEVERFEAYGQGCGLFVRDEPTRSYPYGETGRSILGFVDIDNSGKSGIELVMDEQLAGINGRSLIQKDGKGTEYRIREIPLKEATSGQSVVLTVDWDKQQIVENELEWAVRKFNAKWGTAVFLDVYTGAIIAAADYDPLNGQSDKPVKLNAVAGTYEPGSVFKLIAAAAALESKRIQPSDSFDAEDGRWRLGWNTLRDDHKYDWLTFQNAFELSSNIVMGKIANEIGGESVYAMANRFGFGQKTRCGLNGESRGILKRPKRWSKFVTSTFAIGHGVSVTPLQLAQAFAVVASGGYLCKPYIVKGCINYEGQVVDRHHSRPVKILDRDVVDVLNSFLRGVVVNGTGAPLSDAPFAIAGKTGTAEKPNLEKGGYHKNRFMATFAGYFPADSPQVVGVIILDEPEPIHYGGYTAGPAFKNIAIKFAAMDKYDLVASNLPRSDSGLPIALTAVLENSKAIIPDLSNKSMSRVEYELKRRGLTATFSGPGGKVISTHPAADAYVTEGSDVYCFMASESTLETKVPDLSGLTIREVIAVLDRLDMIFSCEGKGRVVKQNPKPGSVLAAGEPIKLVFKRRKGV